MLEFNKVIFNLIFRLTLSIRKEGFSKELDSLKKSQYYSFSELSEMQLTRLNETLGYAKESIPYYRNKIPKKVDVIGDIKRLPILEKVEIQSNSRMLMSKSKNKKRQRLKTSGGSTGAPVTLLKDNVGMAQEMAAAWRGYGWAGINIGDRQARFWGIPRNNSEKWRAKLIDFVCNRERITAFGYDDDSLSCAFNRLIKFRPDYFYGYVSIIVEFGKYVLDHQLDGVLKVKSVITTSEVLSESDRSIIEKAFRTKVYDEYGCGEVGTIAHECENGSMHINSENLYLEIVDEAGNAVKPGEIGQILVTDFTNHSMPLIRYAVKDFASISTTACKCGRGLPVLDKIYGRQYDSLVNNKGESFHGEFFLYIVEDLRKAGFNIIGVQFIQNREKDILVKLVYLGGEKASITDFIKKRIRMDFDSSVKVNVEFVSKIEREPSGKLRVVKRG